MKGILGRKVGMTEVFTKDGKVIPVTVIEVEPNTVTQVKTVETDGYNAIQLGVCDKKEKNATKASIGHAKKANTNPKRFLKEIRNFEGTYSLGDTIKADIFEVGEVVDVTGTSKGKGTQGVIKRYGQHSGPDTHGSRYHRRVGSLGTMRPMRVIPGKKLPGHMGDATVTIQNLEIVDVNLTDNYILVSGNVPGAKQSLVLIKSAVKNSRKKENIELVSYEEETPVEETVVDEVVETTEAPVEATEVVEETVETETKAEEGTQE
jgi:large subunit ribosomal protein L3